MDNAFKTNVNSNVMDIHNLDSLRKRALGNDKGALKEVAQQFESLFTNMLMKSMREANAVFETDSPLNNRYTQFYRGMQDQQFASDISKSGSLGLADVIVQQLSNDGGNYLPAAALKGDRAPLNNILAGAASPTKTDDTKTDATKVNAVSVADSAKPNSTEASATDPKAAAGLAQAAKVDPAIKGGVPAADKAEELPKVMFSSPEEFISSLTPFAKDIAKKLKVSPTVLLAQAALETGWGKKVSTSADGSSSHNLFNIKADKRWEGPTATVDTLEFINGVAKREKHQFRSYKGFQESFEDFANFLQSSDRYSDALAKSENSAHFLNGLQEAGYATDPNYADKIQNVMKHKAFK